MKNKRIPIKWLVFAPTAALLLAILLVIVILTVIDQESYRRLIIRAGEKYTDYAVMINGDFSLEISREPTLTAGDIVLRRKNHDSLRSDIRIGYVTIQVHPSQLFSRVLFVRRLELSDVVVTHHYSKTDPDSGDEPVKRKSLWRLAFPVMENASLHNMLINVTEVTADRTTTIWLHRYTVDGMKNAGTLRMQGDGSLNEYAFHVRGTLGSLEEMIKAVKTVPPGPENQHC